MEESLIRPASHADVWYSSDPKKLGLQLDKWLVETKVDSKPAHAIIAPYAAYKYSGACAAFAFNKINPCFIKRVFILGPSHFAGLQLPCALTRYRAYHTPFYDLEVDQEINAELLETDFFEELDFECDKEEYTIEMQLPYLAKAMEKFWDNYKIVPILVGNVTCMNQLRSLGVVLGNYLRDPSNFFIISSNFCHWGKRFNYTPIDTKYNTPIYKFIKKIDDLGIWILRKANVAKFHRYLDKYENTICGKMPILILLHAINYLKLIYAVRTKIKCLKYKQSDKCRTLDDFSVSYVAAYLNLK